MLVFSHDAKLDVPALMAAFATEAGFVGALGSRQTTGDRGAPREAGATDADLARLYAPAGLDIGAATVEETAIAVLAEILATRAPLRASAARLQGPIRRDRGAVPS